MRALVISYVIVVLTMTISGQQDMTYDRYKCVNCVQNNATDFDCDNYRYFFKEVASCPSNCQWCTGVSGGAYTQGECLEGCFIMDTWCYTSFENCELPTDCAVCLDFGYYYKPGEGCVELCEEAEDDCYSPAEGCPSLEGITDCNECVSMGGFFTGEECYSGCTPWAPCITECP
eukprot:TRINITY_DN1480_c0_g3_i1.p3 TRINITY_DN1480_c0_g3~~TRINITY_DN1480_c0_g3_i1.p3  ORF type:complete len:174 (-),score=12.58 TRINITY_DN1480_c0_g3_i1:482-1003(-)